MRVQIVRNIGLTRESFDNSTPEYDSIDWAYIPHNIVDIGDTCDNVIRSQYLGHNEFELESLPISDKLYIYYMKEIIIPAGTRCNKITAYMYSDNTFYTYYTDNVDKSLENLFISGLYKDAEDRDTHIHFTPECPTTDYCVDLYIKAEYPEVDIVGSRFKVCMKEYKYI
jgi:hypothetical protein